MTRYVPLIGLSLIVFIGGGVRPLLQYYRYGTFGVCIFRAGGPAQKVRDSLLILLLISLFTQAVVAVTRSKPFLPNTLVWHGPLYDSLQVAGPILMFGGIALFAAAQLNLGNSWRIGVDEHAKPGLVTSGLYSFCRHPIFLGLLTTLAGYAALLPTPLSIALVLFAYVGFRSQVAVEEDYLLRTYGEDYRAYASCVGRFVPGLGRLKRRSTATASTSAEKRNWSTGTTSSML
jgi:protein-S-isoprenylcysteine O-methyltransferase Ste14